MEKFRDFVCENKWEPFKHSEKSLSLEHWWQRHCIGMPRSCANMKRPDFRSRDKVLWCLVGVWDASLFDVVHSLSSPSTCLWYVFIRHTLPWRTINVHFLRANGSTLCHTAEINVWRAGYAQLRLPPMKQKHFWEANWELQTLNCL